MAKSNPNVLPFFFRKGTSEFVERVNQDFPLRIKKWEAFIDRISKRYPYIGKAEVALIVKTTFKTIRELLLEGCSLTLTDLLTDMRLRFYTVLRLGIRHPALKVKLGSASKVIEQER